MPDIRTLREAVEAGMVDWIEHLKGTDDEPHEDDKRVFVMRKAYNGSLDAAKALHDALLPGCEVDMIIAKRTSVMVSNAEESVDATQEIPARAWLIAILKALEARANG